MNQEPGTRNIELKRGECLGLIGRNGAGKTTLLRMLNGLIKPDTGRIVMRINTTVIWSASLIPLAWPKASIGF